MASSLSASAASMFTICSRGLVATPQASLLRAVRTEVRLWTLFYLLFLFPLRILFFSSSFSLCLASSSSSSELILMTVSKCGLYVAFFSARWFDFISYHYRFSLLILIPVLLSYDLIIGQCQCTHALDDGGMMQINQIANFLKGSTISPFFLLPVFFSNFDGLSMTINISQIDG
uniref:Uncharacterized protein n=2 Tax=Opuntia streptacantha TaxID=393608 RepID=A0A7C9EGW5_OPUST